MNILTFYNNVQKRELVLKSILVVDILVTELPKCLTFGRLNSAQLRRVAYESALVFYLHRGFFTSKVNE